MKGIQLFINFRRTKEFNFKIILKVPNFVFRFVGKKILEFCEATKSYITSRQYSMTKYCQRLINVFVSKTVWDCIVSYLTSPSASSLKWACLTGPYPHLIPANSYFYVNIFNFYLPLNLIDASQYFFNYQLEANKQPHHQSNYKNIALAMALDFFLDSSIVTPWKLIYTMPWVFHNGLLKRQIQHGVDSLTLWAKLT